MPSFLFPNRTFFPTHSPQTKSPLTGTTVTMAKNTTSLYLTPAATLAALTIKLPPNPLPGAVVAILSSQIVTALTVQNSAGTAVAGAPAALAVNTHIYFQYLNRAWVSTANPDVGPMAA